MKRIFSLVAVVATLSVILSSCCCGVKDTQHFQKADNFGALDEGVQEYLQLVRDLGSTNELNSVMVLQHGKIVTEYYDNCYGPDFRNICWSASKTFTATAVGFAVQDGLLSLDTKLVDVLPEDMLPEVISDTLASLDVYNLLRMSSGLRLDPIGPTGSLKCKTPTRTTLEGGFIFAPGDMYKYNSHNTYLLGVMVTLVTGKQVPDYLKEKLFEPMGIRNYHWDMSAEGYCMGGWGLYITTESLAKMGQFFLQKGKWNGKQLLNEEWIEQAMSAQIYQKGEPVEGDDKALGYGYQMWVCQHGGARLDGAHGQWSIICPDIDAVIVITENVNKTSDAIKGVWPCFYDRLAQN